VKQTARHFHSRHNKLRCQTIPRTTSIRKATPRSQLEACQGTTWDRTPPWTGQRPWTAWLEELVAIHALERVGRDLLACLVRMHWFRLFAQMSGVNKMDESKHLSKLSTKHAFYDKTNNQGSFILDLNVHNWNSDACRAWHQEPSSSARIGSNLFLA
jgi:hypothetical protein